MLWKYVLKINGKSLLIKNNYFLKYQQFKRNFKCLDKKIALIIQSPSRLKTIYPRFCPPNSCVDVSLRFYTSEKVQKLVYIRDI